MVISLAKMSNRPDNLLTLVYAQSKGEKYNDAQMLPGTYESCYSNL